MIKVQLIVVQGKPEGKTIPLVGPVFRIGRGETCQLRPNSDQVSREHAEIHIGDESATVVDLGSRNGTLINGKPIQGEHRLRSGELLQIGHLTFAVSIQGATAASAAGQAASGGGKGGSLDEASNADIESWLVADQSRPTPDRASGIYDGETVTVNAYRDKEPATPPKAATTPPIAKAPAPPPPKPAAAVAVPPRKPATAPQKPPTAPPADAPKPVAVPAVAAQAEVGHEVESLPSYLQGIDFGVVGEGEGEAPRADADADTITSSPVDEANEEDEAPPEEFIDESNPFYAARKAAAAASEPAKPSYKDSSDAANDILKRMMDRRRART